MQPLARLLVVTALAGGLACTASAQGQPDETKKPLNLVLLLDVSGSMAAHLKDARQVVTGFANRIGKRGPVAVVLYFPFSNKPLDDNDACKWASFDSIGPGLAKAVQQSAPLPGARGTERDWALARGLQLLGTLDEKQEAKQLAQNRTYVLMVTDWDDDRGTYKTKAPELYRFLTQVRERGGLQLTAEAKLPPVRLQLYSYDMTDAVAPSEGIDRKARELLTSLVDLIWPADRRPGGAPKAPAHIACKTADALHSIAPDTFEVSFDLTSGYTGSFCVLPVSATAGSQSQGGAGTPAASVSLEFPQGGQVGGGVVLPPAGVGDRAEPILTPTRGTIRIVVADAAPFWQVWPTSRTLSVSLQAETGQLYARDPTQYANNEAMLSLSHVGQHTEGLTGDTTWSVVYSVKAPPWIALGCLAALLAVILGALAVWGSATKPLKMAFWAEIAPGNAVMAKLTPNRKHQFYGGELGLPSEFETGTDDLFTVTRKGAAFVVQPGPKTRIEFDDVPVQQLELAPGDQGGFAIVVLKESTDLEAPPADAEGASAAPPPRQNIQYGPQLPEDLVDDEATGVFDDVC